MRKPKGIEPITHGASNGNGKKWCSIHGHFMKPEHFKKCGGSTPLPKKRKSSKVHYCKHGRFLGFTWCGHRRLCKSPEITSQGAIKKMMEKVKKNGKKLLKRIAEVMPLGRMVRDMSEIEADRKKLKVATFKPTVSDERFQNCLTAIGVRHGEFTKIGNDTGIKVIKMHRLKDTGTNHHMYDDGCFITMARILLKGGGSERKSLKIESKETFIYLIEQAVENLDGKSATVGLWYRFADRSGVSEAVVDVPVAVYEDGEAGPEKSVFIASDYMEDISKSVNDRKQSLEDRRKKAEAVYKEALDSYGQARNKLDAAKLELSTAVREKISFFEALKKAVNPSIK